jgi:hypothetical protein
MPSPVSASGGGGPPFDPNAVYVPRTLGTGQHINHGLFWPYDIATSLGNFLSEGWICPEVAGYWVSDGYGGGHAQLFGTVSLPGPITGNFQGSPGTSFGSAYDWASGEWGHFALNWDGSFVRVHVNGVCVGRTTYSGTRLSGLNTSGCGSLYVWGSDHINGGGKLGAMRIFERGSNPLSGNNPEAAIFPQREFSPVAGTTPCDFLCDYRTPHSLLDRSPRGFSNLNDATQRSFHHGKLYNNAQLVTDFGQFNQPKLFSPLPQWVKDDTCPYGRDFTSPQPTTLSRSAGTVPGGALGYSAFRVDDTPAFSQLPGLGALEGGTLAGTAAQAGIPSVFLAQTRAPWGRLANSAVCLEQVPTVGWWPLGSATQDIRVTRDLPGTYLVGGTGISFRVIDANNWWAAMVPGTDGGQKLYVTKCLGGTPQATVAVYDLPNNTWTGLRVVPNGTTHTFFIDDGGSGWTQVGQLTGQTDLQTGQGAGVTNHWGIPFYSSLYRYRDWTAM